jgi:hypothetical protein
VKKQANALKKEIEEGERSVEPAPTPRKRKAEAAAAAGETPTATPKKKKATPRKKMKIEEPITPPRRVSRPVLNLERELTDGDDTPEEPFSVQDDTDDEPVEIDASQFPQWSFQ